MRDLSSPTRDRTRAPCSSNHWTTSEFPRMIFFKKIIYFYFFAVLGLRCCARASSSCAKGVLLFVAVRRLLIAVASLVVEHGL